MIVYLKPRAPFSNSPPRSDTLFGAIAWAVRLLFGEDELLKLLGQFDEAVELQKPEPFLISSLFPFVESRSGRTLFLPRPLMGSEISPEIDDQQSYRLYRKLLKTNWVSLSIFDDLTKGKSSELDLWKILSSGDQRAHRLHAGALMTAEEYDRTRALRSLVITGESVRYAIDRGGEIFYRSYAATPAPGKINSKTGFFFLLRMNDPMNSGLEDKLKGALRFLGDKGFGGGASTGRGHCDVEFEDKEIESGHDEGTHLVSLSLLHPSAADRRHLAEHREQVFARLERRKGFIEIAYAPETERVWKPTLVMLSEGATFPRDGERRLYGSLFKEQIVRSGLNGHLRINGLGYTVPLKKRMKDEG
ncbi:MAG: type III-A CRISPR-associated RAMP protein Csm4 [Acidobacteria bacterium]|nr:type III-A CRISPR-associated RAMP protein Csm4 [Acidobacteriota bacterium]